MLDISSPQDYRPLLISRQGEYVAWALTLVILAAVIAVRLILGSLVWGAYLFLGVFFFLAFIISLGNWVDRKTVLRIDIHGVHFQNGLRNVPFAWEEIKNVHIMPQRWGQKIEVSGDSARFFFSTLGQVKVKGEIKGQVGFEEGEQILETIIQKSGLAKTEDSGPGYYYARD